MKIGKITASLHRHEIDLPDIGKSIESRMFVFVEVETDDGLKGFGITGSILPWAVIACIEHHLAPALKGRDVLHTEEIHSHVWRKLNSRTYTGVISNALSAIDIALWDIRGKKENRSIHELLGGYRNWAPTYATFGYPFFDEKQLAEYGGSSWPTVTRCSRWWSAASRRERGKTTSSAFARPGKPSARTSS